MANQLVFMTGDKELDDALRQFVPKLQKKALRPVTRAMAKIVLIDARANAPHVTGELAKRLKVRALPRSRKSQGHGVSALMPGSDVFYALFLEFQTVVRRHKSGKNVGRIGVGHAFLRPALYDNRNRIFRKFGPMLWGEISKLYRPKRQRKRRAA